MGPHQRPSNCEKSLPVKSKMVDGAKMVVVAAMKRARVNYMKKIATVKADEMVSTAVKGNQKQNKFGFCKVGELDFHRFSLNFYYEF